MNFRCELYLSTSKDLMTWNMILPAPKFHGVDVDIYYDNGYILCYLTFNDFQPRCSISTDGIHWKLFIEASDSASSLVTLALNDNEVYAGVPNATSVCSILCYY